MIFTIRHFTRYRYSAPVQFGPHRLMTRPRDSFDLRLLRADLILSPPATLRWMHDPLGNAIAIAEFDGWSDVLEITNTLVIERFESTSALFAPPIASSFPIVYPVESLPELTPFMTPVAPDPDLAVKEFMQDVIMMGGASGLAFLEGLNAKLNERITYRRRDEEGTQAPVETVTCMTGSCRDLAWLFVECARRAGFAARFVSGYLYDRAADANAGGLTGGGATHAWAEVFIPETGWVEYDPTNRLVAGEALLRVAVARTPEQASPISGTFTGPSGAFLGIEVDVAVTSGVTADMQARPAAA